VNAEDGQSQVAAKFRIAGKLNDCVAFDDLEECVDKAAKSSPDQMIHVGKDRNESRLVCQKNCHWNSQGSLTSQNADLL
jgi:hypothetical protein